LIGVTTGLVSRTQVQRFIGVENGAAQMITHSLIVCAFLAFSLAVRAETIPQDTAFGGMGLTESISSQNAILHKDVDLHQRHNAGVDITPAKAIDCVADAHCHSVTTAKTPRAQTFTDLFVMNERSSGKGSVLVIVLLVVAVVIYLSRRSPSTK
jgi:hypothetical protein